MVVRSIHRPLSRAGSGAAAPLAWIPERPGLSGPEGAGLMAGSSTGSGSSTGAGSVTGSGPVAAALVAFERVAVVAEAARVREAGVRAADQAGSLAAALEQAVAAAGGTGAGPPGGVLSGAALAECAALLVRRARDGVQETEQLAGRMESAAELLVGVDEEVARGVAGAGG